MLIHVGVETCHFYLFIYAWYCPIIIFNKGQRNEEDAGFPLGMREMLEPLSSSPIPLQKRKT